LSPNQDRLNLHFNLSHSQGLALYAIAQNRQVGVDLEALRTDCPWQAIAQQCFSPAEQAQLAALPAPLQRQAFFKGWTCKEAYVKATGQGLTIPLDQFQVCLVPGKPAALLNTQWDVAEASRWFLQELTVAPGYAAALAVEGKCQIQYRHLA
jgi:4'-phosphopantetheinyl transferase